MCEKSASALFDKLTRTINLTVITYYLVLITKSTVNYTDLIFNVKLNKYSQMWQYDVLLTSGKLTLESLASPVVFINKINKYHGFSIEARQSILLKIMLYNTYHERRLKFLIRQSYSLTHWQFWYVWWFVDVSLTIRSKQISCLHMFAGFQGFHINLFTIRCYLASPSGISIAGWFWRPPSSVSVPCKFPFSSRTILNFLITSDRYVMRDA